MVDDRMTADSPLDDPTGAEGVAPEVGEGVPQQPADENSGGDERSVEPGGRIPRPQPLGAFPLPAGLLLVTGEGSDEVRRQLLAGHRPAVWPESLKGVELAYADDLEAAADIFARDAASDPAAFYNLFVLSPEMVDRPALVEALGDEWRPLVDTLAYMYGLTSVIPAAGEAGGEIAAVAASAQAGAAVEEGREAEALRHLRAAATAAQGVNPPYEGILRAEIASRTGSLTEADAAVALLADTDLTAAYAEARYQQASLIHELAMAGKRPIADAIAGYTDALSRISETDYPPLFARLHFNLGTAYLAAPVTSRQDQLRAALAVQSLRTAVRLLEQEEEEPPEWAAATLNLANALVYAPSGHQRDNLMEAVDLYETVLRVRSTRFDPAGRARVLSNQATALSHLGLFGDALARFGEAEEIFHLLGDEAAAKVAHEGRENAAAGKAPELIPDEESDGGESDPTIGAQPHSAGKTPADEPGEAPAL
ncbi:MAG: hypothetical protein LBM23_09080 [Propionibacteriaceae bacterium]|jgi:tetratricopeptide (TPR) repeat protein|nr:hypothetical protein [Propionibacteriaceae bacterium]